MHNPKYKGIISAHNNIISNRRPFKNKKVVSSRIENGYSRVADLCKNFIHIWFNSMIIL
jgi:hypothetical protein